MLSKYAEDDYSGTLVDSGADESYGHDSIDPIVDTFLPQEKRVPVEPIPKKTKRLVFGGRHHGRRKKTFFRDIPKEGDPTGQLRKPPQRLEPDTSSCAPASALT